MTIHFSQSQFVHNLSLPWYVRGTNWGVTLFPFFLWTSSSDLVLYHRPNLIFYRKSQPFHTLQFACGNWNLRWPFRYSYFNCLWIFTCAGMRLMKHSFCYSLLSNFRFRRCGASTLMITICACGLRVSFFRMNCCEITRTSFSTGSTPSCHSSSRTSRPTKSCESCGILTVTQSVMQFVLLLVARGGGFTYVYIYWCYM